MQAVRYMWEIHGSWRLCSNLSSTSGWRLLFCKFFIWHHLSLLKLLSALQVPTSGIYLSVGTQGNNRCQHPSSPCQLLSSRSSCGWGGATPVFLESGWNEAEERKGVGTKGWPAGVWCVGETQLYCSKPKESVSLSLIKPWIKDRKQK